MHTQTRDMLCGDLSENIQMGPQYRFTADKCTDAELDGSYCCFTSTKHACMGYNSLLNITATERLYISIAKSTCAKLPHSVSHLRKIKPSNIIHLYSWRSQHVRAQSFTHLPRQQSGSYKCSSTLTTTTFSHPSNHQQPTEHPLKVPPKPPPSRQQRVQWQLRKRKKKTVNHPTELLLSILAYD